MDRLRTRYQRVSFRNRLLLLLIAVSLVQVGVAAYTFFDLQAKPAKQRVEAQLDAALRGVAPVVDGELARSSDYLRVLQNDTTLQAALDNEDWASVDPLISNSELQSTFDGAVDVTTGEPLVDLEADAESDEPRPLSVYVTDSDGEVVAGTRPDGVLVEQSGRNTTRLLRESKLVATVHVPVVIDRDFLNAEVLAYVPKGIDVFVADEDRLLSTAGKSAEPTTRPTHLREGLQELKIGGVEQQALSQPLLEGSITVGATIPAKVAKAQEREGLSALWGFIAILGMMTLGLSWFITRAVSDALRKFASIARELAGGQLNRRIPVTGNDEIAILSSSFNEMAENLEERIESLIDARARMRRQVDLFGEALANASDVEEMLQAVCSLAMESTGATHSRFWTLDEEGRYEHAACIGLRPGDSEPCGLEKLVPVRNGAVRGEGEPAWLVVPATMREGQMVGLLTLVSTAGAFSDDDVHIAERIAVQAAVAIDNARMHEQLRMQATLDGLTGLPNHRALQDELTIRIEEASRTGMPLGVALLDIDNFKRVNDTYGHQIGDEAIKALGRTLAHGIGGMGMVGRYGGEEFVVIMPGCDAGAATRIADRLREDITYIEVPLEDGGVLKITASFGVSNIDQQRDIVTGQDLLHQSDVGLYNAKRSGKNCVMLAGPDTTVIEMSDEEKARLEARETGADAPVEVAVEAAPYDPFDLAA